jgi:hypothetical protein
MNDRRAVGRWRGAWLGAFLCLMTGAVAGAEETRVANLPPATEAGVFGSTLWGTRGGARVESATSLSGGSLVLALGNAFMNTSGLLVAEDADSQSTQRLALVWAPLEGLEVGFRQVATVNRYTAVVTHNFQVQGNPSIALKYIEAVTPLVGIGTIIEAVIPTSSGGTGLALEALTAEGRALTTLHAQPWLDLSLNAGYVFDRSGRLMSEVTSDQVTRFVYDINRTHRFTYGFAAAAHFVVADLVGLSPYLEVAGALAPGLVVSANPLRATVGLRGFPPVARSVEVGVSYEHRLGGAPRTGSPYAGLAPWMVTGQLTLHMGETVTPPAVIAECPPPPEVPPREVVREVEVSPKTFTMTGKVLDATSGQPVPHAKVRVSGSPSLLTTDEATGAFTVWPMPVGSGLVQLSAEAYGYASAQQTLPRGAADEVKEVLIGMKPVSHALIGTFKGSVKSAQTGHAVARAEVFIPALNQHIQASAEGTFEVTVKAGRYQVLVSAPGHLTQTKELTLRDGEVVILNIDLHARRRAR